MHSVMKTELKQFIWECGENSKAHGFHGDERSVGELAHDLLRHNEDSEKVEAELNSFLSNRWNDAEKIALIHEEVSELLGEFRNVEQQANIYFNANRPDKPEGKAVEAADIAIRLFDFIYKNGMIEDFVNALELKHAYNKTRPHLHGRRF